MKASPSQAMELLVIFSLLLAMVSSVKIGNLVIPPVVEQGVDQVVLDCPYEFSAPEADHLEIKWYLNNSPAPFFQWIPGMEDSQPQIIGSLFENKIDLNYSQSPARHEKQSSLLVRWPTVQMSGVYTCKVSCLTSEAVAEAEMFVFSPVDDMEFVQKRLPGSKVNVSCKISGMFPQPIVKLTWGSFDLIEDHIDVTFSNLAYQVSLHKIMKVVDTPQETVFGCEASIPGTEYIARQEAISCSCKLLQIRDRKRRRRRRQRMYQDKILYSYNTVNKLHSDSVTHVISESNTQKTVPVQTSVTSILGFILISIFH